MDTDTERFLPLKADVFEILLALDARPLHGYAILKQLEARGIHIAASLLYRKLRRIMEDGLVEESGARPAASEDDARRNYYAPTALGTAVVRAEAARIVALSRNRQVRDLARGSHA